MLKIFVVLLLMATLVSLFSGLYFLSHKKDGEDASGRENVAKALTARISLSILVFALVVIALMYR